MHQLQLHNMIFDTICEASGYIAVVVEDHAENKGAEDKGTDDDSNDKGNYDVKANFVDNI